MISSDLSEIFASTDRLLVLDEGRLTATLTTAETTPEEVLSYAAGLGTSVEGRDARMSNQKLAQTGEQS
jgi:ABC-type dipeptide/oligopeptide/nickel transport system ATPase component